MLDDYTSLWKAKWDTERLILVRMVLMNPFFDTKETNISYPHAFTERLMELISKKEPDVVGKG